MADDVVLGHGTNAGPRTLERVHEHVEARGFRCHSPPLPHHEDLSSPEAATRLTGVGIADYVAALGAVVDGLAEPPIIVGHSLGGVIAQLLAAQQKSRAIVLLNGSVNSGILPTTAAERELGQLLMSAGRFWETTLLPDFPTMARFGLNRLEPAMQREVFDRLGPESGQVMFELFFWIFDQRQTTKVDYERISCRSLHVSGADDLAIPPSTSRKIAARHGEKATFHEARGFGHYLTLEPGWREIADLCADWMKGL